jgi:hypothetical protein
MFNHDVIWYVMPCFLYVEFNLFVIRTHHVCGLSNSAIFL